MKRLICDCPKPSILFEQPPDNPLLIFQKTSPRTQSPTISKHSKKQRSKPPCPPCPDYVLCKIYHSSQHDLSDALPALGMKNASQAPDI